MATRIIRKILFGISITLLSATWAFAQGLTEDNFRKFSLSLNSGASLGDVNRSFYFMSSNFTTNVENTPTFGAGIQYALSPAWSLELGYQHTMIKGRNGSFKTNMNAFSLKNIFNLNQILSINEISNRINPFLTLGIGYDLFKYAGPQEHFTRNSTSYNGGIGVAYKLSNALDLFTQYEYHLGSNSIDNETNGWGADLINTVTGGIRINFGKRNAIHPSWRPPSRKISRSEYDHYLGQGNRIEELNRQIAHLRQDLENQEKGYEATTNSLNNQLVQFNKKSSNGNSIASNIQCIEVDDKPHFTDHLSEGHYVQIFASHFLMVSNYIKGHAQETLKKILKDSAYNISIYHRDNFYEVMIGVFDTVEQAREIQKKISGIHPDAYVITFPRQTILASDMKNIPKNTQ